MSLVRAKTLLLVVVLTAGTFIGYHQFFDKTVTDTSSNKILQGIAQDPEFLKYFG